MIPDPGAPGAAGRSARPRSWLNGRIRAGLVFLILASLWRWLAHPGPNLSSDLVDGVTGVLFGVSIGCVLSGLRANALRGIGRGPGPEAEGAKPRRTP